MSEHIEDCNSPEETDTQEDPIVMYLVVHELGMSVGKLAAQIGHAVGLLYSKYMGLNGHFIDNKESEIWQDWQSEKFRKVTLTANDSKWNKLKTQLKNDSIDHVIVVDAGFTEIPSGSETVIGIWPMRKSNRPPILKKLRTL